MRKLSKSSGLAFNLAFPSIIFLHAEKGNGANQEVLELFEVSASAARFLSKRVFSIIQAEKKNGILC